MTFQVSQVRSTHLRRRVATIRERVNHTVGHAGSFRSIHKRVKVSLLAVHPAT